MEQSAIADINRVIENLKGRFKPNKELMTAIAGEMLASVEENFRNEGANVPGGWPALRPSTIKAKDKKNLVPKILQARGNLFKANQASATDNTAMVSNNKIYARIHNEGGVINIGARTRTLFHRTDAKGNLLKRSFSGDPDDAYMLTFAKKSHKQKSAYTFGQTAYSIKIPARPFMVLTDRYRDNIVGILKSRFQ